MRLTPKKWTLIALKSYIEYVHFFKANLITLLGISVVCKCIIFMDKHNVNIKLERMDNFDTKPKK